MEYSIDADLKARKKALTDAYVLVSKAAKALRDKGVEVSAEAVQLEQLLSRAFPLTAEYFISAEQADAVVEHLFRNIVDGHAEPQQGVRVSLVAAVVVDAAHQEIALQPLHEAYRRAKERRSLKGD